MKYRGGMRWNELSTQGETNQCLFIEAAHTPTNTKTDQAGNRNETRLPEQ